MRDRYQRRRTKLKKPPNAWTSRLVLACIVITSSASFTHGYGIGAHNQFAPYIVEAKVEAGRGGEKNTTNIASLSFLEAGMPQFVFTLGNFIGAFTALCWYKIPCFRGSRKIFYANLPFSFMSVAVVFVSFHRRSYITYVASRFIQGYQGGMACTIVPPYLIELAPKRMRGAAGTLHQLAVTFGILLSQLAGIPQLFGTRERWPIGFAIGSSTSVVAFFMLWILSDTPAEALKRQDDMEAEKVLKTLRNKIDVSFELKELKSDSHAFEVAISGSSPSSSPGFMSLFRSSQYRWPLIISMTLLGGQALCGINAIFYYSDYIFRKAGISSSKRPFCIFLTGVVNLLATMTAMKLMDVWGRRTLIVWPCTIMIVVFAILPVLIILNAMYHIRMLAWISVLLILVYVVCFAIGMGPIPYIYASEVFRHDSHHVVLVAGLLLNYTFNAIVSISFPALNDALGDMYFWFSCLLWQHKPHSTTSKWLKQEKNRSKK